MNIGAVRTLTPSPSVTSIIDCLHQADALIARAVLMLRDLDGGIDPDSGIPIEMSLRLAGRRTRWDARELLSAADALDAMPATSAALADGTLSWSQARAVVRSARGLDRATRAAIDTRIATRAHALADGEPEQLVEEVDDAVARARPDVALAREDRAIERSFLALQPRFDGGGSLYGEADAVRFATIAAALDAAAERPRAGRTDPAAEQPHSGMPGEDAETSERRRAAQRMDALVAICEASQGATDGRARPRPRILATLDVAALAEDGHVAAARVLWNLAARPARLTPVATDELLCDADVVPVIFDRVHPIAVGRAQPTIPAAVRTAVIARDGGCRFPGCGAPAAWSDVHHIVGRARGGSHDVANLVLLCRRCHRRVHRHRWRIEHRPDGSIAFTHHGRTHASAPRARIARE